MRLVNNRVLAEILGVHPETVNRYRREGLLSAIRIGRKMIRYDLDAILVQAQEVQDDQPARTPPVP